jgi:PAS domain S-box-containing protein
MDIRTKLVFALVAVALGSMFALGLVMYATVEEDLRGVRLEELDALVEVKKLGLQEVAAGWRDRVSLIASRTQLRVSLQEHNLTGNPEARESVHRILVDAMEAVAVVESLAIYDRSGHLLAYTDADGDGPAPLESTPWIAELTGVSYQGVSATDGSSLRVDYAAPLLLDGEEIGVLHVQLTAQALLELTRGQTVFEDSDETLIVMPGAGGQVMVLHREGRDGPQRWDPMEPRGPGDPVSLALERRDTTSWQGMTDEEGKAVWVATRYLGENNWGLVVKIDADEGLAPVVAFRERLTDMAVALGAFAMVVGTILGLRFAKPIHDLAAVADRIRQGSLSARATVKREDEVGFLARAFNQMAEELEDRVTLLGEYQRFFETSLDMLCIAGPDGFFKRINPAFERILGWTAEELLSRSFLEFVHPDDREKTEAVIEELAQGIPTVAFENRYQCADGSWKIISWRAQPDPDTGLTYAIARDITKNTEARKKAKDEIQALRDRLFEAKAKLRGGS